MASQSSQLGESEQTPTALLHEMCMQNGEIFYPEYVPHETDPKLFSCIVNAFGLTARGSGRSKKEAKHDASRNLLAKLSSVDRFKQTVKKVPVTPKPTSDTDAVMILRNICVQRNWPLPTFELMQSCGQPHLPIFTYVCQLASIKRTGTFSSKKGAKQIATHAVIDAIQHFKQNEEHQQIATGIVTESLPTYNDIKESDKKLWAPRVRDRHKFFLQLAKDDLNEAKKILMDDCDRSSKDRLDLVCAALKLKYDIEDIPNHQHKYKVFYLRGNHDCTIAAPESDLYNQIIAHFKTMLHLQPITAFGCDNMTTEAKYKAEEVLKVLDDGSESEDFYSCDSGSISNTEVVPNVFPLIELPTVEETVAEYRRLNA